MTYKKLFYLKYKKGLSTQDLARQYPHVIRQVSEIALLEVPEDVLKEVLQDEADLLKVMSLKKQFSHYFPKRRVA